MFLSQTVTASGNVVDNISFFMFDGVIQPLKPEEIKVKEEAASFKAVAEVLKQDKDKKIIVFKYKAKKNERKKQGHRQPFTRVKILSIKQV